MAPTDAYLAALPDDLTVVHDAVRAALSDGYDEALRGTLVTYEVPLSLYPDTYNGQPLAYAALTSQKNHCALYLTGPYAVPALRERLKAGVDAAGKRLDMGKSCLRFRTADALALDAVAECIAALPIAEFIATHEAMRAGA